jgi:methionine synthase II (cobalamin-independent)
MGELSITLPDELLELVAQRAAELVAGRLADQQRDDGWLRGAGAIAAYIGAKPSRVYALSSAQRIPVHHDGSALIASFLVEWEDTEREGDYSALRYVPDGPTIAMGIISSKKARVEDDDEVLRHMEEAAGYVDMDRLVLCTQCFASSVPGNDWPRTHNGASSS